MATLAKKVSSIALIVGLAAVLTPGESRGEDPQGEAGQPFPSLAEVREVVESHFAKTPGFQGKDLIVKSDVAPIFGELERRGWKDVSRSEAASRLVDDGEFLARQLRSPAGQVFMRRVSGEKLIYDRLDRISRMAGGQPLIHDMIRLPDGHRYAAMRPARGVPPMTDFLPKGRSGKAPHVPDLDKPTGRIYTVAHLLEQLAASLEQAP